MSEQCEWEIEFKTGWKECGAQTVFDDRFCPKHQVIAIANGIDHADPLTSIAESLERLADIAEADFRLRRNVNNKVPIKSFISTVTIGKG